MRCIRVGSIAGLVLGLLCAIAYPKGTLEKGSRYEGTFRVSGSWVFNDEQKLGAFLSGTNQDGDLWVKLRTEFRWVVATQCNVGSTVRFSGTVEGPRGTATQITDSALLEVDAHPIGEVRKGFDYRELCESVFDKDLPEATRLSNWEKRKGHRFEEVGLVDALSADRKTLTLKFRAGASTSSSVLLRTPPSESDARAFTRGSYVAVAGEPSDYTFRDQTLSLVDGAATVVPEKRGTWPTPMPPPPGTPPPAPKSYVPQLGEIVSIAWSGSAAVVFGAIDDDASSALNKAIAAKDNIGVMELMAQGKVYAVDSGTAAKVIDRGWFSHRVRLQSGKDMGVAIWVPMEAIQKR